MFFIQQRVHHDWHSTEENVEDLVEPFLVETDTRSHGVERHEEMRHHEEDILVESVVDKVAIPPVIFSPVEE